MLIENISVVMIAKNAQTTIEGTLKSISAFKEVILYLNGCDDKTRDIASNFSNVNLIDGTFEGFGKTKNKAVTYASNDWILFLDSDEIISHQLIKILTKKTLEVGTIYRIHRINFYKTKEIKHCWKNDLIIRIYNKTETEHTDDCVHEIVKKKDLRVEFLNGTIKHYPYNSISDFIIKLDHYSTLFAKNNVGKRKITPWGAFFNGLYAFIRTFVFKKGFLDGYPGLLISFSHMATNFYKYLKLYEMNHEHKK